MSDKNNTFEYQMAHSPLKESVLNWYDFKCDASVLLIGERSCGLKELFLRRDCEVTVLGESDDISQYDYVIALDEIEMQRDPQEKVREWTAYVKPEGSLIISCDNRFGLKYICGTPEKYTEIPYLGINGYFEGLSTGRETFPGQAVSGGQKSEMGRLYSRQEVIRILGQAGAEHYKFFYPVPDSRMPQMIYTDSSRNGSSSVTRLADYDYEDKRMTGIEHRMFGEMIDLGALPFCANSFIIEITKEKKVSDISFAVVTTDRGKEYGMATTVRESGLVYKRPLYEEGEQDLRKLCEYTEELAARGIPVVEGTLKRDSVGAFMEMPYVEAQPLTEVLDSLVKNNRDEFIKLFDVIVENIHNSYTAEEGRGRVYLDLAPCNAFFVGGVNPILFYDQEFVAEEPLVAEADDAAMAGREELINYSIYRTIKYYFASSKAAREVMKPEELAVRYGIKEDMTAGLEMREKAFLEKVRKTSEFDWLFKAATPDYESMLRQAKKIAHKKKPYKVGYVPGVFDLFHTGHLRLIERCKERCEYLIVGVLTDELVEYYKGKRPVISCENRMAVIRGLAAVDEVIPVDFSNTDKLDAWEQLHYDCHFSGDDHVNHWKDVHAALIERGSNMEFFSYTEGISSTMIKDKIGEQ